MNKIHTPNTHTHTVILIEITHLRMIVIQEIDFVILEGNKMMDFMVAALNYE